MSLFRLGYFTLHSGEHVRWKIECDALNDLEIITLAEMLADYLPPFSAVEGVPRGGLRLAKALEKYRTITDPLLIVDDVLTTGNSMERQRNGRNAIGAVIFARGVCPSWVTPLFQMPVKT